jgi:uncharacterized DUF497 family protein
MFFNWDARKAAANLKKPGVSFSEATEVFGDDLSSCVPDPDYSHVEEQHPHHLCSPHDNG